MSFLCSSGSAILVTLNVFQSLVSTPGVKLVVPPVPTLRQHAPEDRPGHHQRHGGCRLQTARVLPPPTGGVVLLRREPVPAAKHCGRRQEVCLRGLLSSPRRGRADHRHHHAPAGGGQVRDHQGPPVEGVHPHGGRARGQAPGSPGPRRSEAVTVAHQDVGPPPH